MIGLKKVYLNNTYTKELQKGLVLCKGDGYYYINYFEGTYIESMATNITSLEKAKEEFLNLVWLLS